MINIWFFRYRFYRLYDTLRCKRPCGWLLSHMLSPITAAQTPKTNYPAFHFVSSGSPDDCYSVVDRQGSAIPILIPEIYESWSHISPDRDHRKDAVIRIRKSCNYNRRSSLSPAYAVPAAKYLQRKFGKCACLLGQQLNSSANKD